MVYETTNSFHSNSEYIAYYQCRPDSYRDNALLELFEQTVASDCFNVLRTKVSSRRS